MYPKYKNFQEDLNRLNNRLTALYYTFQKLKPEKMSASEKETAKSLKDRFDMIQVLMFDLIKGNPQNDFDRERDLERKWGHLKSHIDMIQGVGLVGLPYAKDTSSNETKEDLYEQLGSDNNRFMYEINKQIGLMGSDLVEMEDRANYYEAQDSIDAYINLHRQYKEELETFTKELPYSDYGEMLDAKKRALRAYSDAKDSYAYYEDGFVVANAQANYELKRDAFEDIKNSYLGVISVINDQKHELEEKLKEAKEDLAREEQALKNYDATSARYKKKFDELAEKDEQLSKEIETFRTKHYQMMEIKNESLMLVEDTNAEFQGYANGIAKKGEDPTFVELRKEYAKLTLASSELKELRNELDTQLDSIGYLTRDAKEKIKTFSEGVRLDKIDDDILKLYKDKNLKGIFEKIDFKNAVINTYNKMAEKYVAYLKLDEKGKKEFYAKVNSLGKLREHMKKHNAKLSNQIESYANGTLKHKTIAINKNQMPEFSKAFRELYSKWFEAENKKSALKAIQEEINQNGEKFSALEAELRSVKEETTKLQKLFVNESRPTHIAAYTEIIETLPKKIQEKEQEIRQIEQKYYKAESERRDASYEYNIVAQRARDSKERLERNHKVYLLVRQQVDKFEHFVATSQNLEREGRRLRLALNIDDNMRVKEDFWKNTREAIDAEVREFLLTAEVGKRAGHKNSDEFEAMRSALYHLSGKEAFERSGKSALTPEEYLHRLVIVKSAASNYKKLKNKETFALGTTMRKMRLDFASRLETFANRKLQDITEMMKKNESLSQKLQGANLNAPLYADNKTKLITEIINKPFRERRKAEEEKQFKAAQAQKRKEAQAQVLQK